MTSRLTVDEKADIMIENGDCSYDHTDGNILMFQAKSQSDPNKIYIVRIEIQEDNTLDHDCTCPARVLCKHITCAYRLVKTLELRVIHDPRLIKHEDNNDDDKGKVIIKSDDD